METKQINKNRETFISAYMNYRLENGRVPESIYKFSKICELNESDFYSEFSSFEVLEQEILNEFFVMTISLLKNNEEYLEYDEKNKLLSFYFTFFEILTKNRSYVLQSIGNDKLNAINKMKLLRISYLDFIKSLDIKTIDLKSSRMENAQDKAVSEAYWGQFVFIINFWANDISKGFEKTDILIEKLVDTSFKIQDIKPLESVIDLGKFIFNDMLRR